MSWTVYWNVTNSSIGHLLLNHNKSVDKFRIHTNSIHPISRTLFHLKVANSIIWKSQLLLNHKKSVAKFLIYTNSMNVNVTNYFIWRSRTLIIWKTQLLLNHKESADNFSNIYQLNLFNVTKSISSESHELYHLKTQLMLNQNKLVAKFDIHTNSMNIISRTLMFIWKSRTLSSGLHSCYSTTRSPWQNFWTTNTSPFLSPFSKFWRVSTTLQNGMFLDHSYKVTQALCRSVLQRVAACCSVLQCVAVCCSVCTTSQNGIFLEHS